MKPFHLLIVDPQNDFCDPEGALFVPGADQDMKVRLPAFIRKHTNRIKNIHVTLDSHHKFDIAHPIFWRDNSGNRPQPFTVISAKDVEAGQWKTAVPNLQERALQYVQALKKNGRYPLCIWPEHCLIGSWGHNVVRELFEALLEWENNFAIVHYNIKGSNPYTEHYSVIQADVPDPSDPDTQANVDLINRLFEETDIVAIAGEASSHCVANTVRDIIHIVDDPKFIRKIVLLTDAMSSVPGFEKYASDFFEEMKARNITLRTTVEFWDD